MDERIGLSNQEIFDHVARHLLTQNRKSRGEYGCHYRSDDGLKCAIGCLLPDSVYSPQMEGRSIRNALSGINPTSSDRVLTSFFEGADTWLLVDLQVTHDNSAPSEWKAELLDVASRNKLSANVLSDLP